MGKILNGVFDWLAISTGITALILLLTCPESMYLDGLTGAGALFCAVYIIRVLGLWIRRPQFDWHLFHGSFLRKVICLVLLIPCLLTIVIKSKTVLHDAAITYSEELIFEDDLYKSDKKDLKDKQTDPPLLWSVYYHFIDPGNQHMTTSKTGRGWSAFIAILGVILLNGLFVSSIIGWIDSRKERWLKGEVRYKWFLKFKPHYTIIGGNDMVESVVRQIFEKIESKKSFFRPYILIQTSRDIESFRRELFSTLTEKQQQRVVIYYGNRNSEKDIEELNLCNTEEMYILGEETRTDDIESYHDTMNMECLRLIGAYLEKVKSPLSLKRNKLICRVMFEYQTTFSVFQFYDIDKKVGSVIDFRPFNYYEAWAQKVFINKEIAPERLKAVSLGGGYLPLEGCNGIKKEDANYVHLFVVGMSRMGVAVAIEAAHLAHYPNYTEQKKIRTKITFIDKRAAKEKEFFMGRFKELFDLSHYRYGSAGNGSKLVWQKPHAPSGKEYLGGDFLDIEWEFINGGIEQTVVQDYIFEATKNNAIITIAICLPESNRSHASALYLHKKIYESEAVQQVLVYNRYGNSIVEAFYSEEAKYPYLNKLKPFGAPDDCFDTEWLEQSEKIGEAVGDRYMEINKMYINPAKIKAGQVDTEVKYKGKSQVAKFWSNIYNGNTTWTKLRSIGYNGSILFPDQISLLSDVEHNRWNIEQLLMNFRPLTEEEQRDVIENRKDKEVLKGEMAHLNICSNKRLTELSNVDVVARAYDEGLTSLLPDIYAQLKNN